MITLDDVIKEVSKRLDIDKELIGVICKHPFLQTVEIMKSEDDTKDIMFNKLFKFKLKKRYKDNKTKQYSSR